MNHWKEIKHLWTINISFNWKFIEKTGDMLN